MIFGSVESVLSKTAVEAGVCFAVCVPVVPARVSHCQHVVGDATERVGWDLRDVGMINKFPAEDDSEHRLKELMWEINSNTEICLHTLEWGGGDMEM